MKRMKKIVFISGLAVFIVAAILWFTNRPRQRACTMEAKICPDKTAVGRSGPACEFAPCPTGNRETNEKLTLTSSAFSHNENIPKQYTCDGENINPPLTISAIPMNAKSLALIVDDPDAPAGTWFHWLIWNITPETKEIPEGSVPDRAMEGTTSFGKPGYGGPCPPAGTHRYFFKLYALDTVIGLDNKATVTELEREMQGHSVAQTQLVGRYSR